MYESSYLLLLVLYCTFITLMIAILVGLPVVLMVLCT
jgi:hypothetical protein